MSDKEKALDALQAIINLTTRHTMSAVNDEIIAHSGVIERALRQPLVTSEQITCYYTPGRSVPTTEAAAWYASGDQNCQSCGGRCQ